MKFLDFNIIKNLGITAEEMFQWTDFVWKNQDKFIYPPKQHIWDGDSSRYIVMPAVYPEGDVAGVKFICRNVDDIEGLPKRNSNIMIQRISEHGLLGVLDSTWLTNMRTGACAYYNATKFSKSKPQTIAVYGLGLAARAFMFFWTALYKDQITMKLLRYKTQAEEFVDKYKESSTIKFEICDTVEELFDSDIIVSCVSFARKEICSDSVYREGCTIVPVHTSGFQNCDLFFDRVAIDDVGHVEGYRYYEQFKSKMIRITDAASGKIPFRENDTQRIVIYNGGLAIFDLYYALKTLKKAGEDCIDLPMAYPAERFWL